MTLADRHLGPFRYRRRWFARQAFPEDKGLAVYSQYLGESAPKGWTREDFLTVHNLLVSDREGYLAAMKKNTSYEIKRADKDGTQWEQEKDLGRFLSEYNAFAREKRLGLLQSGHLTALGGSLWISRAVLADATASYHVYVVDQEEKRARLLYSMGARFREGADKAALGRANRWLHLEDMVRLQALGIQIYDWGGITPAGTDPEREGINQFKLGFGGEEVPEPNFYSPMLSWLRRVMGKK